MDGAFEALSPESVGRHAPSIDPFRDAGIVPAVARRT
jgi:hypothetical protein